MSHNTKVGLDIALGVALVLGALYGLGYWFWFPFYHHLWIFVRYALLTIIVTVVFAVIALVFAAKDHYAMTVITCVLGVVGFIGAIVFTNYESHHALYEASDISQKADAENLAYEERAPYEVAEVTSSRNLGTTNGDRHDLITYIPGLKKWTTTVNRRGVGVGYNAIQEMDLPLIGTARSSDVTFCSVSPNAKRSLAGSLWFSSLAIQIARQTGPSVVYNNDDSFAVCQKGKPYVYVPLTRLAGGLIPYEVPAGVAVYDGSTGKVSIEKNLTVKGYPLYPMSVAASQRESLKASGGMWSWMMNTSGYEDTTGDDGSENSGEYSLQSKTGESQYLSPLTPRGSSSSIVAVSTVNSSTINDGKLERFDMHMFPANNPRLANSTVEQNIFGDVLAGYKATNLKLFEIVPSDKGEWTATIGNSQTTIYRAIVTSDGTITLKDENGNVVASTDKTDATGDSASSNDTGSSKTPAQVTIPGDVQPSKPLSKMTPKELSDWSSKLMSEVNAVNNELASRVGANK